MSVPPPPTPGPPPPRKYATDTYYCSHPTLQDIGSINILVLIFMFYLTHRIRQGTMKYNCIILL